MRAITASSRMPIVKRYVFLVLPFCLATLIYSQNEAATSPTANPQPAITIQSNVRVVLLDVVVTDKDGKAVTGLNEGDFRVLEDGKPQKIASFTEHNGAPVSAGERPKLPKDVYTNYTELQNVDSINVILMDALNTQVLDQTLVHQQIIKFLKTIPVTARVAIFTLSSRLRMVQAFTTDSSQLLAALNDPKLTAQRQSPLLTSQQEAEADENLINMIEVNRIGTQQVPTALQALNPTQLNGTMELVDPADVIRELLAERTLVLTQQRVRMTLAGFQELARYLSAFPGRKNVIWVSGAFPVAILPNKDFQHSSRGEGVFLDEIKRTTNLCAAAQIAIYPVGAQGLMSYQTYQANGDAIKEERPSVQTQSNIGALNDEDTQLFGNRAGMETVAKETGGHAFQNTNDLSSVLARVTDLGMHYYTISYSPTNTKADGRFRQISVELPKGKYKLDYRQGYYATDKKSGYAKTEANDPLLPLLRMGLPDLSQMVFTLGVRPAGNQKPASVASPAKGPTVVYTLDFGILLPHMKMDDLPDGKKRAQLEVRAVAYDEAGKPISLSEDRGDVDLSPAVLAEAQQGGIHLPLEIKLPANASVHLRAGVYDMGSGNAGTLGIRLKTEGAQVAAK